MTITSSSLRIRMERMLYLWRSSKEKVVVDLHLVVLADQDGVHIVLVAKSPS